MQQMLPPKKDTQRGSIVANTPLTPRSQTSRKSSQMNRQSFEQQELYSSRRFGLNLKDPQKVEEMIKIRQQRLPRREAAKDGEKDLREISKAYDVLKNALPEINNNQGVIKDQELLQFYKQQIVINQNPRKNFFEFNTYFYKNYQANNNGPCTTLPQLLIKKVESFQNKLEQLIKDR
ncbi:unnamed protein product [Paramecium octaurelia]|uniref:Uncharacterized protein n=1 Tax=Paramecium octaurelia TaxID=43137 RepID=A0A8S1X670_PAROT|nr:unnamed protein product [Paramecium octaurelia]